MTSSPSSGSTQPFEWSREADGVGVEVSLLLGPTQRAAASGDDGDGPRQRFVRWEIAYMVGMIRVQADIFSGPLAADSNEVFTGSAPTISRKVAKAIAYEVLGQAPPVGFENEPDRVRGFHVRLAPRAGRSWGEVETIDDVDVTIERAPAEQVATAP